MKHARLLISVVALLVVTHALDAQPTVLDPSDSRHYVDTFNAMEDEPVTNLIPNANAWEWMVAHIPFFDCPSRQLEEIYYYRWWTFRKHIKQTPHGRVLTEFITPVSHAGPYNTVSCALGHHLAEGRWLRDVSLLDEYTHFWFRSADDGGPASHFHNFSSWAASALYQRALVTGDTDFVVDLLPDLVRDYETWEVERQTPEGLFWQYDVRDGMEESISGGRRVKNLRPTINSYMVANAQAIAAIAALAGDTGLAATFSTKAKHLHEQLLDSLWDDDAQFFKVRLENGAFSDAREAIGYIPWMFNLAPPEYAAAWAQLKTAEGFWAPRGITTAERRHPQFRSHGTGTCEWDGAVWPFATSQTLTGLANLLRGPAQDTITTGDFFEQLLRYAAQHQRHGLPYLGEYHDEITGEWLIPEPKAQRSRYYNHSTFNDLVIGGLVGIVPGDDNTITIQPLLPPDTWRWFCLDGLLLRGRQLTVIWDQDGSRYDRGAGLSVWVDGEKAAGRAAMGRLVVELPLATNPNAR